MENKVLKETIRRYIRVGLNKVQRQTYVQPNVSKEIFIVAKAKV